MFVDFKNKSRNYRRQKGSAPVAQPSEGRRPQALFRQIAVKNPRLSTLSPEEKPGESVVTAGKTITVNFYDIDGKLTLSTCPATVCAAGAASGVFELTDTYLNLAEEQLKLWFSFDCVNGPPTTMR